MKQPVAHNFHIPIMGVCFTLDSPYKVAQYGISSAISLGDDGLMETMREFYCKKLDIPFEAITNKEHDYRAKRITAYLNLMDVAVKQKFEKLRNSAFEEGSELVKYLEMLPDYSELKQRYAEVTRDEESKIEAQEWIRQHLVVGSIDVNIMTKLDKPNFNGKEQLPIEFNEGHAAVRGYANSTLHSSIILSAGLNPRLYSYIENFEDFYPDENGYIKKKITLKVSDYRSAYVQGMFFAKKGLWVSEYRIESGLNCGGHAFATEGYLMGPILKEFKKNKDELIQSTLKLVNKSLELKGKKPFINSPELKITAQGGVGTAEEHSFLIDHYQLDSIGWGTPFLLVPEASSVEEKTMKLLIDAQEEDLYLSEISPIGVPFNSLRTNTKDIEKRENISAGTPGTRCTRKYLAYNNEYGELMCTASRQYQTKKISELKEKDLSELEFKKQYNKIVDKSCICVGLGNSILLANELDPVEGDGVSICPGPNMAYFSKISSLKEMIGHIYGKTNLITRNDRPNLFIKELSIYLNYLQSKFEESETPYSDKEQKFFTSFIQNLNYGINYYRIMFSDLEKYFKSMQSDLLDELEYFEEKLGLLEAKYITI